MRNRETIEREINRAREDLEASLAELRHVVAEKVDVKARARVALEKGKYMAQDAFERSKVAAQDAFSRGKVAGRELAVRGKDNAIDAYYRSREIVSERPVLVAAIVGGVIATGALIYIGRQRDWW
jgi:CHASE1-domain containing sensor protein